MLIIQNKFIKINENLINTLTMNFNEYLQIIDNLKNFFLFKENQKQQNDKLDEKSNAKFVVRASGMRRKAILTLLPCDNNIQDSKTLPEASNAEILELRYLRKENSLLKQQITKLIEENKFFRNIKDQFDENILELQQNMNNTFKIEMENVEKAFQIYKVTYS